MCRPMRRRRADRFPPYDGAAALRGAHADVNYALSATALTTDGTNVSRFGSEDDGYRNRTLYARAGWAPVTGASLDASVRYRDSRSMFDPQDFGFPPGPTFGLIIDGDRQKRRRSARREAARALDDRCA